MFPKEFLWGAATAAHQIEGNTNNQWSRWEKANAERLARESVKYNWTPKWDSVKADAQNPANYITGTGADSYNRYEEDIEIIKKLGLNAFRFSIEWSRIEPEKGKFNRQAIEHYRKLIKKLRESNIEPIVTLWHWTVPLWFYDSGDWMNDESPDIFAKYVEYVLSELSQDVTYWVTLNEPDVYASLSYYLGEWPPQHKSFFDMMKVTENLIRGHKKAFYVIKKINQNTQISIAKQNAYNEPYKNSLWNRAAVTLINKIQDYHLDQIKDEMDFIGLNHYFHNVFDGFGYKNNTNNKQSDMGWGLNPEAIYHTLKNLKRFNKPVIICENGLADKDDEHRTWYITEVLKNVERALADGVKVEGYLHWSLLDNFEWAYGFWPRFGLVEIDYETKARKIRKSAMVYSEIVKSHK